MPGINKACVYPQNMLAIPEDYLPTLPTLMDNLIEGNETYQSVASNLRLLVGKGRTVNDGTSFSTALAANVCAKLWINDMNLAPAEIIDKLLEKSAARL